ncbi:putative lipoprotein, partial [Vibrio parahaemolyticus EKP-028]
MVLVIKAVCGSIGVA